MSDDAGTATAEVKETSEATENAASSAPGDEKTKDNDKEEQEHLKHILLAEKYVLCYEQGNKRFFSKYATEQEKETFKYR